MDIIHRKFPDYDWKVNYLEEPTLDDVDDVEFLILNVYDRFSYPKISSNSSGSSSDTVSHTSSLSKEKQEKMLEVKSEVVINKEVDIWSDEYIRNLEIDFNLEELDEIMEQDKLKLEKINMHEQLNSGSIMTVASSSRPREDIARENIPPHRAEKMNKTQKLRYPTDKIDIINTSQYYGRPIGRKFLQDPGEVVRNMPKQGYGASMLLLTNVHPQKWPELLDRWEQDLVSFIDTSLSDLNDIERIRCVENTLGQAARNIWNSWKQMYPEEFSELIESAENIYNVTTQVKIVMIGTDPSKDKNAIQFQAAKDLERLTIDSMNDIVKFSQLYYNLAANTIRVYKDDELTNKYFAKLPKPIGDDIYKKWVEIAGEHYIGLGKAILFTFDYLKEQCINQEIRKTIQNYSYCNKIYIPQIQKEGKPRKKLKRSTYYRKHRPRSNHVKKFKKHKPPRKCKCYICGELGHYANECRNKKVSKDRLHNYEELNLVKEWDIVSVSSEDSENDSDICSIYSDKDFENMDSLIELIRNE